MTTHLIHPTDHTDEPTRAPSPTDRRRRLGRAVATTAVAAALAIGGAASPAAGASTAGGEGLWDQIRDLEIPSGRWPSVATAMGLSVRGEWISDDGLRWEHLDGRTVVVAHPRTAPVGSGQLWDRVRAGGVPEDRWLAVAAELGLSVRGPWISDDGLRWEHLDGRTIVAAAPREEG